VCGPDRHNRVLTTGSPATFAFEVDGFLAGTVCSFAIHDELGHAIAQFESSVDSPDDRTDPGSRTRFVCSVDELPLLPGRYRLDVEISALGHVQDALESVATFHVEPGLLAGRPVAAGDRRGSVVIRHRWTRPGP
jgi:lipopolysaccharide transport system ATP-binding protein